MRPGYWLLKTEPSTYSFSQLLKEGKTHWNGVRNFQARNFLQKIKKGDLALIYHSGDEKAVVGIAKVVREAYPDPDPKKPGEWVQVDLEAVEAFQSSVPLKEIKARPAFKNLILIKQSRLSVMPVTADEFQDLSKLAKLAKPAKLAKLGNSK